MRFSQFSACFAALAMAIAGCDSGKQAQQEQASSAEPPEAAAVAQRPEAGETEPAAREPGPAIAEATKVTLEATVAAINHATREVTLEGADGKTVDLTVGDEVKNLPQVEIGDRVTVEYLEAVTVEVLGSDEAELGAGAVTATGTAEPGKKPGGAEVAEMMIVAVIEAIDTENEQVTLKGPRGGTKTVRVRNPANLEKVTVGDKVRITYTRALAVDVTEQPATE